MVSFEHANAGSIKEAVRLLGQQDRTPVAIAGGQDLMTMLKDELVRPGLVVNLKTVPGLTEITYDERKGLSIGALATLTDVEEHPVVRAKYPALAQAAAAVGTPQIRNMGTVGGNLCQRPQCWYFRGDFPCLRRGGDYCSAAVGQNKYHCILGGDPCYIVHPSDLAVPLRAYGASVEIVGPKGKRTVSLDDFFLLPSQDVRRENVLEPGEVVTWVRVPPSDGAKAAFVKFTERGAWDFAVVSVAAVLRKEAGNGKVAGGRIVLGGVAPVPWLAGKANAALTGVEPTDEVLERVADLALEGASPLEHNAYKVPLAKTLVKRALQQALAS
ncbi:MAG: xanthine dehydrogenase family protein subunit M [Calditrichaeota bacterium]|nr:xanthine dehydrogenase family protein subunit M [Calditrichota bacterium]